MFKRQRIRYINNLEDINKIIDIAADNSILVQKPMNYQNFNYTMFSAYSDNNRYYEITTGYVNDKLEETDEYVCTWRFDKTGVFDEQTDTATIARLANKAYRPYDVIKNNPELFHFRTDNKVFESAKSVTGYNPKYNNTEHRAVIYDLNSAFAAVLQKSIIDTYNMRFNDEVKENEVGFLLNVDLEMMHTGDYADVIFPIIDTPESLKEFIKKYYDIKKTAPKKSKERALAKQILNVSVGLYQRHNPFLRAYVIHSCNEFIMKYVNKYYDKVCCWNTDAIYTTERIRELDKLTGDEIGKFKVEYDGLFRQSYYNKQLVDSEEVKYYGVSSCLFKKDYNLLTDSLPDRNYMPYRMNDKLRIELNTEYNYEKTHN